jgi:isopenicillin N synthase-like dioxygenase
MDLAFRGPHKEIRMTTLLNVPVIDIGPWFGGSAEDQARVAAEVGKACEDIGFLVITGHGVSAELCERVYATSKAFFDLPKEEKLKCARPDPTQVRGYAALGSEAVNYSLDGQTPPDLNESLSIGPPSVNCDDPYFGGKEGRIHFAPNLWPAEPAGLKPAWLEYFHVMETLAAELMRIFAEALKLPRTFFDDKIDRHISMFRVLNYPDQPEAPLPGQLRSGAHSDYGSLTIIRQEDRPGGLQVCNQAGEWVGVPFVPESFVVNIADLMMQWTNDHWLSTMHRVANPPRDKALDSRRISLVFFHQPNYDAVVECIPSCLAPGEAPKYAPVTSGDHLLSKFVRQASFGEQTLDAAKAKAMAD